MMLLLLSLFCCLLLHVVLTITENVRFDAIGVKNDLHLRYKILKSISKLAYFDM